MSKRLDLVGQIFGKLTVLNFTYVKSNKSYWNCLCECGIRIVVSGTHLKSGHTISCGCYGRFQLGKKLKKHGFSHSKNVLEKHFYDGWKIKIQRCTNPNNSEYNNYGGRGITIDSRWLGIDGFIHYKEDLWENYLKHIKEFGENNTSLDRINPNGNYEPGNVRWATASEQSRNTRVSSKTNNFKQAMFWRNKLNSFLGRYLREGKTNLEMFIFYFGCTPMEFKQHIESNFIDGMNWSNRGMGRLGSKVWQLDHIIECNKFDLSKEEDRKICYHYTNFQPLWWEDNNRKSRASNLVVA